MNYKYYYFSTSKRCVVTTNQFSGVEKDLSESDNKSMIINLEDKEVKYLSSFFKNAVIDAIINKDYKILIDCSSIEHEVFYSDESFIKLMELINTSIEKCNETIREIAENIKKNDNK